MRDNSALRRDARQHLKENLFKILIVSLAFTVAVFAINLLTGRLSGADEWAEKYSALIEDEAYVQELLSGSEAALAKLPALPEPTGFAYVLTTLLNLALMGLTVGYKGYFLRRVRGSEAQLMDIFPSMRNALRGILITLLVDILVAIGLLLFIVPGIMLAYRYRLAV